jgi:hypothetical protein
MGDLRNQLVQVALAWEQAFGNAPHITTVLSEYDAARLIGCSTESYSYAMRGMTAVQKGYDFKFNGDRYQVKGTRASGKPGSFITNVPKVNNYEWDLLVWICYDPLYQIQEAWLWDVSTYRDAFDAIGRLSPKHLRQGKQLVLPHT